jgi:hypothetical protein
MMTLSGGLLLFKTAISTALIDLCCQSLAVAQA